MKTLILAISAMLFFSISNPKVSDKNQRFPIYEQGLLESKSESKPMLILFTGITCANNLSTQELITSNREIQKLLSDKFIFKELKVDDKTKLNKDEQYQSERLKSKVRTVGQRNMDLEITKFEKRIQPYFVIVDYNERIIGDSKYISSESDLIEFLKNGIQEFYH